MIRCVDCDSTEVVAVNDPRPDITHRCIRCGKVARDFPDEIVEEMSATLEAMREGQRGIEVLLRHADALSDTALRMVGIAVNQGFDACQHLESAISAQRAHEKEAAQSAVK